MAFYFVNREGLRRIPSRVGVPSKLINIIRSPQAGMRATVLDRGCESEAIAEQNGTKQGCVLAPIIFGIVIVCVIYDAFNELDTGIRVNYRSDSGVYNLRRLQAITKVSYMLVREPIVADDCALAAHGEEDAQTLTDAFDRSAEWHGLTISLKVRSACSAQTWCIIHHNEHPSEPYCTQNM